MSREEELVICWRCGVEFNYQWRLIPGSPCRDCRQAIDELDGKQVWYRKSGATRGQS